MLSFMRKLIFRDCKTGDVIVKVYVVRHGETEYNKNKVYFGWTDICLNEKGRCQCAALKKELNGIEFDEILASPAMRAAETAKIITDRQPIKTDHRFRELNFGEWEGLHYWDIEKKYPLEWKAWGNDWQHYCIPGGECFMDFYERVRTAWNEMKKHYVRQKKTKNILLAVHGGTLKVIILIEKNLPIKDYWKIECPLGSYHVFKIEQPCFCII